MSKIKVGDRVRVIASVEAIVSVAAPAETHMQEGVAFYDFGAGFDVRFDEETTSAWGRTSTVWSYAYDKLEKVSGEDEVAEEAPEQSFSIGDRVQVLETNNGAPDACIGKFGTITDILGASNEVTFDEEIDGSFYWYFIDERLKLAEGAVEAPEAAAFAVGDRVKVIGTKEQLESIWAPVEAQGAEGVIVETYGGGIAVEFSEDFDFFNTWNFDEEHLEKVTQDATEADQVIIPGTRVRIKATRDELDAIAAPVDANGAEGVVQVIFPNDDAFVKLDKALEGSEVWGFRGSMMEVL